MTEDNIIIDPEEIKKIIDDQFKSKEPEKTEVAEEPKKPEEQTKKGNQQQKGNNQKKQKGGGKQTEKAQKAMTLKQVIQKIVPYSSGVYAEHIFR